LVVVCAPSIAVAAGVFVATAVARGGSTAVAAAVAAMPASIVFLRRLSMYSITLMFL
jgi:predicted deacylase